MNDKKISYSVNWKQSYKDWEEFQERLDELRVECSELEEAKEVLARIMAL